MYETTWMGHWWNGKRWTTTGECPKPPFSSHRIHRTGMAAWREFNRMRHPDFVLMHFYRVAGKRRYREWWWTERKGKRR